MATGIGSTWQKGDPVWREAEVAGTIASCVAAILTLVFVVAMMSMQHKCLVKFLGAGVMTEPTNSLRVLFTVQVCVWGAILLVVSKYAFIFLWLCTGVHVWRLIRSKDLEPATEQCNMGGETSLVQGYSQGVAPSASTRR